MRRALLPALALLLVLVTGAAAAAEVQATADLEPEVLGPGDVAFFSIEVTGGVFNRVGFDPDFELVNFDAVGNPSRNEGVSWINGVTTRKLQLTWRLRARELGLAAVRGIRVRVGGQVYELPAQQARVVEDPPPSARRPPQATAPWGRNLPRRLPDPLEELWERRRPRRSSEPAEVRLLAEVTPARPWQGQQVTYTLWLYTQASVARINPKAVPEFRGFWVEEIPRPANLPTEPAELDGERFYRTAILRRAVFPLRPGRYEIDPAEIYLVLRTPAANPFGRSLTRHEQVERASNRVTVDVRPLPPPPPDLAGRFTGLVGRMSLDARLVPSELAVGEASTLELTLAGRGNAAGLAAPQPELPDGVELLPAAAGGGNRLDGLRVHTERTWSYPLVPREPGTWRLPPVEVPYFDPDDGTYRLASAPPLVLRARRGAPSTTLAGGPALHPIKNAALPDGAAAGRRPGDLLPWLFALPWALLLAAGLVRLRRRDDDGVVERFDRRLDDALAAERPRQTAIAIEAAWHDLLAERFDLPPELPPSRWPEHVTGRGAAADDGDALGELMDDLHYLRNAPQLSTIGQLTGELAARSSRLARRLTT